ncbi:hypothetical protein COO91_08995 [Nostoc flagelliforme CCNUN1]|uniref:Uncharacterized protein n=1 Tax=Nostoc flagelliforme CCNUN1 TaxID=2038116 RepID=A0A2K8T562_9NOSO|nr:hypothetical protein COO91_08995 [Nostoc flagelliforme CCNUN1]
MFYTTIKGYEILTYSISLQRLSRLSALCGEFGEQEYPRLL